MNGFQKFIAQIFRIRQYAASKSNTAGTSGWRTSTTSADAELSGSLAILINRSWDTYYNNASIYGALQGMVDQVVGDGIRLQSKVLRRRGKGLDLPLNQEIEAKFDEWASNPLWCDVAGKLNFYQMQNTIFINCKVAGGILVRIHTKVFRGSPVPLALELIDIQQLADNLARTYAPNGNEIRMGVEIDRYGYPVAYWILDKHPGDIFGGRGNYNPVRYPAQEILHIYNRDNWRPGQTRGVPALAPILITARNLQRFNHYELVKAAAQSAISWVRTRMPDINQPIEDEKSQQIDMADGMVYDLLPGEDLKAIDASSPNPNAPEFTKDHQRQLAKGLKISAYQVSGDLSDANYGSLRVGLLNDQLTFRLERGDIATDFNKPIFRLFMDLASLSFLKLPGDFETNKPRYLMDCWVGLPFPWIDPSKDVKARTDLLAAGLTTKTQILKEQGWEYEDFAAEKAQEKAIDEKYGLTDQAAPDQAGAVPNDQTDPNQQFTAPMEGMTPVRSRFYFEGMTPIPNQIFERAKNCTKGQVCGNGCISKAKTCRQDMPEAAKPAAKKAVKVTKEWVAKKGKTSSGVTESATTAGKGEVAKAGVKAGLDAAAKNAKTKLDAENKTNGQKFINNEQLEKNRSMWLDYVSDSELKQAEKNVSRLVDEADLMVRIPTNAIIEKIIDSGRLKSQFETGTSKGTLGKKIRSKVENELFGYKGETPPEMRPIYGYLGDKNDEKGNGNKLIAYGDISLVMRKDVKGRSTMTSDDSLLDISNKDDLNYPTPLSKVSAGMFASKTNLDAQVASFGEEGPQAVIERMASATKITEVRESLGAYLEVQMHGQVRSTDIAEIRYSGSGKPSEKILLWAKENNVNIVTSGEKGKSSFTFD